MALLSPTCLSIAIGHQRNSKKVQPIGKDTCWRYLLVNQHTYDLCAFSYWLNLCAVPLLSNSSVVYCTWFGLTKITKDFDFIYWRDIKIGFRLKWIIAVPLRPLPKAALPRQHSFRFAGFSGISFSTGPRARGRPPVSRVNKYKQAKKSSTFMDESISGIVFWPKNKY